MTDLVGPTEESNWLIPGKLIVGSCPITFEEMEDIAEEGVDFLVCLLDHEDFSSRISKKEYTNLAQSVGFNVIFNPIPDGDIISDEEAFNIARMIMGLLFDDYIVYLHCWGGHGRAGTIGAMVLGDWYGISFQEAIYLLQRAHRSRSEGGKHRTPQTKVQIYQASRFFEKQGLPIFSERG